MNYFALFFVLFSTLSISFMSVSSHKNGFSCSSQTSMVPNFDEPPQFVDKNPPPYNFYILNSDGDRVKYYNQEIYTIKVNSSTYFRRFLIQARLSNVNGTLLTNVRAGEFLYHPTEWAKQGVEVLQCPSVLNDSITSANNHKKSMIEVKWISRRNEGAIQFLITIVQETSVYWVQWAPKFGLIIPSKDSRFSGFAIPSKKRVDIFKNEVRFLSSGHVSHIEKYNKKNENQEDLTADEKDELLKINQRRLNPVTVIINTNPDSKLSLPKPKNIQKPTTVSEDITGTKVTDNVKTKSTLTTKTITTHGTSTLPSTRKAEKTTTKEVRKATIVQLSSTSKKVPVTHATTIRTTTTPTPIPSMVSDDFTTLQESTTMETTEASQFTETKVEMEATADVTSKILSETSTDNDEKKITDGEENVTDDLDFTTDLGAGDTESTVDDATATSEKVQMNTSHGHVQDKAFHKNINSTNYINETEALNFYHNNQTNHTTAKELKFISSQLKNVKSFKNETLNEKKMAQPSKTPKSVLNGSSEIHMKNKNVSMKMKINDSFEIDHVSQSNKTNFKMSMKSEHGSNESKKVSHKQSSCSNVTCLNNGTCEELIGGEFECMCTKNWMGNKCQLRNYCADNKCKNNGICMNGNDNYTCHCPVGYLGKFCEVFCPSDNCKNGGSCLLDNFNKLTCSCKPGFNGTKCEKEINECDNSPCMNNATCTIKKDGGFKCQCLDGFMGTKCQRPCQDMYQSCKFWQEEDKCTEMRSATKFYDVNCASSCGQCVYLNSTIRTINPLPVVLEPFHHLLGTWSINYSNPKRYPLDFPDAPKGYYEELNFFITTLPVFGTPSINYTAVAVNNADPNDAQTNVGFMTLKPFTEPTNVSIISTGNDGITIIEEGLLYDGHEMELVADFFYVNPLLQTKTPNTLHRTFKFNGDTLEENVQRMSTSGDSDSFQKTYRKLQPYVLY